ncbi:MAG: tRNA preQ1(34) S-adenosylmethionine ribosyltransferase-isomerase QueA [Planctomycetes bacterium]|nr:tRNA preQ1(34) S-adenosylmethionine ribosyltransferase-isomerase QueA [Planctomycetota bacterium]
MPTEDFNYELPASFIAQLPYEQRDYSRLMVISRYDEKIYHKHFLEIVDYLSEGDVLVLNNTKVLPLKLIGKRKTGGITEVLLVKEIEPGLWECLANNRGKTKENEPLEFSSKETTKTITGMLHCKNREKLIRFVQPDSRDIVLQLGKAPLPPYIKRRKDNDTYEKLDKARYQTVYALKDGSIAAPTAGLHFTEDLLKKIKRKNIHIAYITLHVGRGTFEPIRTDDISKHIMGKEYYEVPPETISILHNAFTNKQRIIAVGTTACRTLETTADYIIKGSGPKPLTGWTDLFISPPYQFKIITTLLTNFHLPKSTPLILTCTFGGKNNILRAYREAIANGYRFYSYGDAMLIL